MAKACRSAKSGSDWTKAELDAYNIHIQYADATTFFGTGDLPEPQNVEEILTVEHAEDMIDVQNCRIINLLDIAMKYDQVDNFTATLLSRLGYISRTRVFVTRNDVPLLICGKERHAKADVCLVDRAHNDIILLVQKDKRIGTFSAKAQLIASAIGAFQYNNFQRKHASLPELDNKTIPGIVMIGTSPVFYKIPITSELVQAVIHGAYPTRPTVVMAHIPQIPRPNLLSEGMKPLDNRGIMLQCYEAFKRCLDE